MIINSFEIYRDAPQKCSKDLSCLQIAIQSLVFKFVKEINKKKKGFLSKTEGKKSLS